MSNLLDIIGKKINHLTVISFTNTKNSDNKWLYLCECDCGFQKLISRKYLLNKKIQSCGRSPECKYSKQIFAKSARKYNPDDKDLYFTWLKMKQRCTNPNVKDYSRYGGRGIKVDPTWENDYIQFITDMGPKPSKDYTLDRIDSSKGYSKDNCRWASVEEQNQNRRSTRLNTELVKRVILMHFVDKLSIAEISNIFKSEGFKISQTLICNVLHRKTWKNIFVSNEEIDIYSKNKIEDIV